MARQVPGAVGRLSGAVRQGAAVVRQRAASVRPSAKRSRTAGQLRSARRLRRWAGLGPFGLLLIAASFALAGYAGVRLLDGDWFGVTLWFVGVGALHDLVLLPAYSLADRGLRRLFTGAGGGRGSGAGRRTGSAAGRRWLNAVRFPAALSVLLLLLWFPLIARRREARFEAATGLSNTVFWPRWLVITGALFALSALWALADTWRTRNSRVSKGS